MKIGDLVRYMGIDYQMIRGKHIGIVLGLEEKMWASRYSGCKSRPITEVVVYLANGKIVKWYSEKVEVVNASR